MRSVELFAGAGGLAIGMANAGFKHAAVIEWNPEACETFRENQRHHTRHVEKWPLHQADVRAFDYRTLGGKDVTVVSGGPRRANHFPWVASTRATWTTGICSPRLCARCANCGRRRSYSRTSRA